MNSRFEHTNRTNYLVLVKDQGDNLMTEEMLVQNQIPGLLPLKLERMNGGREYYYDITSRHSIGSIIKKGGLHAATIRRIMEGLDSLANTLQEYLLEPEGICLSEELIYTTLPEGEISFLYFYEEEREFQKELRKLFQYMMEYVDYQDKEAVSLSYGLYQATMKENYTLADVMEVMQTEQQETRGGQKKGPQRADTEEYQLLVEPKIPKEVWEEETEESAYDMEKDRRISGIIAGGGVIGTGVLGAAAIGGMFGEVSLWGILIAGAALTLLVYSLWCLRRRQWKQETRIVEKEVAYEYDTEELRRKLWEKGRACQETEKQEDSCKTVVLSALLTREHRTLVSCQEEYPSIQIPFFPFQIGKMEELNDGVISHAGISRVHCRLQQEGELYRITDCNSTNGVMIDGTRLLPNETKELPLESEVVLGSLRYIFR